MKADLRAALVIIAVLMFLGVLASIATTCGCTVAPRKSAPAAVPAPVPPAPVTVPDPGVTEQHYRLRLQAGPTVAGIVPGWFSPVECRIPLAELSARAASAEQIAKIRRLDAAAAAEVRREDREGWWLLGVYTLAVLVGFVGIVAALYMRSTMFLTLPGAAVGVAFLAYFFLNAFVWLAWALVAVLAVAAGLGIWWLARHGGIMQGAAIGAVKYAEEQKSFMPAAARKAMHRYAKDNHKGISTVIDALRKGHTP